MRSIVIGLGETGGPLRNVLDCDGFDLHSGEPLQAGPYDVVNICIPYGPGFIKRVVFYDLSLKPNLIIVHSTVPIGTTACIPNAVHSPILGMHNDMENSIRKYKKWVGGPKAKEAAEYLSKAGLDCQIVEKSEETEALKLMCLLTYGVSIALAEYRAKVAESVGFDPLDVQLWDIFHNLEVQDRYKRPILDRPGDTIGGHCVIQNMSYLNDFMPSPLIEEVLKFKPLKRDYAENMATV
jgi:hypothetical protein